MKFKKLKIGQKLIWKGVSKFIELVFIDDDFTILDNYESFNDSFLEKKYHSKFYQDSRKALEHIKTNNNKLIIISDFDMPYVSGEDIYNYLYATNKECVFILISGSSDCIELNNSEGSKVRTMIFPKPISLFKLSEIIKNEFNQLEGDDKIQEENIICLE